MTALTQFQLELIENAICMHVECEDPGEYEVEFASPDFWSVNLYVVTPHNYEELASELDYTYGIETPPYYSMKIECRGGKIFMEHICLTYNDEDIESISDFIIEERIDDITAELLEESYVADYIEYFSDPVKLAKLKMLFA